MNFMEKKISERIKQVLKNRGMKYEEVGKKLGMSKQGVSWVLNNRVDEGWNEKERMYWEEKVRLPKGVWEK